MTIATPKIYRYFSTAPAASQLVPLFKNPNSSIILSSLISANNSSDNPHIGSRPLPSKTNFSKSNVLLETYKGTKITGQLMPGRNNLVFLNKKGSHTPNPNLISYNFPGAAIYSNIQDYSNNSSDAAKLAAASQQSKIAVQPANLNNASIQERLQPSIAALRTSIELVKPIYNINKLMSINIYKLLSHFFKSMYCLISKPVFIETPDKIKIQLFYFLCIPKILTKNKAVFYSKQQSTKKSSSGIGTTLKFQRGRLKLTVPAASNSSSNQNKKFYSLLHKLKNFNRKHLNVKFNLFKLSQPSCIGSSIAAQLRGHRVAGGNPQIAAAGNPQIAAAGNLFKVFPKKFKFICSILSKLFNKSVELELIRLHQPYYDSNILVNFLALIINKKNIGVAIQRLYNSNIIKSGKDYYSPASRSGFALEDSCNNSTGNPWVGCNAAAAVRAYLSGLNIKISGRLMREPIIPRITTKKFEKGFTAKGKINYSDVARFTHKNRKGAFTITVKSGQKFF